MSLKAFHIAFIVISVTLCLFLAAWGINAYRFSDEVQSLGLALSGIAGLLALVPYSVWVKKKFSKLGAVILNFLGLLYSGETLACSVCFGDPNSLMTQGAKSGILFLVFVIVGLLVGIGAVCFSWIRKAQALEEGQS